jgi:hypothetical protein
MPEHGIVTSTVLDPPGVASPSRTDRARPATVVVSGSAADGPVALPTLSDAPVLAGVIGSAPADPALRLAFAEAARRDVPVLALGIGTAAALDEVAFADQVRRWRTRYPGVPATVSVRRGIDAAVVLAAASRGAALLVLDASGGPTVRSIIRAVRRRARCPVAVVAAR